MEDIEALLKKRVADKAAGSRTSSVLGQVVVPAKGKTEPRDRGMNNTEKKYAAHLEMEKVAGRILFYEFECIKLRLADDCQYQPDFMVMDCDGFIELHDSKALWSTGKPGIEPDALIKMKGIAENYPMFKIITAWFQDGAWRRREF